MNHINLTLREQLDQATIANQKLSQEIQKVNHEWIRLREQLETREREWREEENVIYHLKCSLLNFEIQCYKTYSTSRSMTTLVKSMPSFSIYGEQLFRSDVRSAK